MLTMQRLRPWVQPVAGVAMKQGKRPLPASQLEICLLTRGNTNLPAFQLMQHLEWRCGGPAALMQAISRDGHG